MKSSHQIANEEALKNLRPAISAPAEEPIDFNTEMEKIVLISKIECIGWGVLAFAVGVYGLALIYL